MYFEQVFILSVKKKLEPISILTRDRLMAPKSLKCITAAAGLTTHYRDVMACLDLSQGSDMCYEFPTENPCREREPLAFPTLFSSPEMARKSAICPVREICEYSMCTHGIPQRGQKPPLQLFPH